MNKLIVGTKKDISKAERQELLNNSAVEELIKNVKPITNVGKEDLRLQDSFLFESLAKVYKKGIGAIFANNNKTVNVIVFDDRENNQTGAFLFALHEFDGGKALHKILYKNGQIQDKSIEPATEEVEAQFLKNFETDMFSKSEEYFPGILKQQQDVESLGFFDGCLPGGYLWCGGGCHNYEDNGGDGTWINETDWCCKYHDYCYRYDYSSVDGCDDTLCTCVKNHKTIASAGIRIIFCD